MQQQMDDNGINRMQTPPEVVTTKDLLYLKDAMSWELIAAKKCNFYSHHVKDQRILKLIDRIGKMHQKHYHMLLKHTKMNNAQTMANVQKQMQQNQQAYQQMQQQQQSQQQNQQQQQ